MLTLATNFDWNLEICGARVGVMIRCMELRDRFLLENIYWRYFVLFLLTDMELLQSQPSTTVTTN